MSASAAISKVSTSFTGVPAVRAAAKQHCILRKGSVMQSVKCLLRQIAVAVCSVCGGDDAGLSPANLHRRWVKILVLVLRPSTPRQLARPSGPSAIHHSVQYYSLGRTVKSIMSPPEG